MSLRNINDLIRLASEKYIASEPGPPPGKTYADFYAHISSLPGVGTRGWSPAVGLPFSAKLLTSGTPSVSGTLYGSSYKNYSTVDSTLSRFVQHALPSYELYDSCITNGFQVYMEFSTTGSAINYTGAARNNYTSSSYTDSSGSYDSIWCTKIIWWNDALKRAETYNPFTDTPVVEYTW